MSTILKPFQQQVVSSATDHFTSYLTGLKSLTNSDARKSYKAQAGTLLLEAPTGTGKTLMAGRIAEAVTQTHDVTWLWFAPFAGLIQQTESVVRSEFPGLRVRSLRDDRIGAIAQPGEVRVATWALISNENTSVHQPGELGETLEEFVGNLRDRGLSVGVVIDEAHHTFQPDSRAFAAYRDIINPDLTLLLTATPRDKQLEKFKKALGLEHIERLAVSRERAVEARLIKRGVHVAVFDAESTRYAPLVDFQKSALVEAVKVNRRIQEQLEEVGVPFTPLLLVQVDSEEGSVDQAREWLEGLGMPATAIRVHTADEPNPSLLADAHDEDVQALIFKMAVATGFDAPRAFVLASLRNAKDTDFGVQIIGRILRVDRRLQTVANLPATLEHGYVVLANAEGQQGLLGAGERINAIRDSLQVHPTVVVLGTPTGGEVVAVDGQGQARIFPPANLGTPDGTAGAQAGTSSAVAVRGGSEAAPALDTLFGLAAPSPTGANGEFASPAPSMAVRQVQVTETFRYPKRPDVPERLETALVTLDQQLILDDVVNAYPFEELLPETRRQNVHLSVRVAELFTKRFVQRRDSQGALTDREIDKVAQIHLFNINRDGTLDLGKLHEALARGLQREFRRQGWAEADEADAVHRGVQKLLALHPGALETAISVAVAKHTSAEPTKAPLPSELVSLVELPLDDRASYTVIPEDLNTWESAFISQLERGADTLVEWWHRNPVRRPYSVAVPIPGQPNFYPDFVVKVRGRTRGNGIVLVEIKGQYNDYRGNAQEKAQAIHPTYGNVLMLHWRDKEEWRHVRYNADQGRNELREPFDLDHLRTHA